MKKLLLAFLLLIASVAGAAPGNGVISKPSRYSVDETITRLEAALKSKGMTIFARVDHAGEAAKAGLKMRPSQLLVFGNPKAGTPIMQAVPVAAIDLPLKALAWEDADGKVWLSYTDPVYFKERFQLPNDIVKPLMGIGGLMDAATR
jgi:uncharacterized protein (DUF302 family)